jgi:hypothetical protein
MKLKHPYKLNKHKVSSYNLINTKIKLFKNLEIGGVISLIQFTFYLTLELLLLILGLSGSLIIILALFYWYRIRKKQFQNLETIEQITKIMNSKRIPEYLTSRENYYKLIYKNFTKGELYDFERIIENLR